ncbi:CDP-diacylglycerol--glycerol-3-phosphate 3-phosphatidyltransferase [Algimonas arctica]|uniref:CDP-diacylglycerol--glycerol-3-phosphate 3-phosphatidyltransferase n=1 Tax=Algimonas arctica TaxID=1479486 RepID=A0A8J3G112_9PROT|nr:CDP-alcohol phosphatidyltransferase family protein [Algimonas arctica]GHA82175.1 CDP-diacylglycerol--glycerol-3-phosphate 3-phosphatidyltransferase [Algimonas arctica]
MNDKSGMNKKSGMNDEASPRDQGNALPPSGLGGAFADGLTLVRFAATPVIMALILWQWPDPQVAILASVLFIVAAVTDVFDDWFGGASRSVMRRYGYLDDIADTVLIVGALLALTLVLYRNGLMHWAFYIPVFGLIGREILVGLLKGFELSRYGWPDNPISNAKVAFAMLGTTLLVGSPWLTQLFDRVRAGDDRAMEVYSAGSPLIWIAGQACLWLAAVFSLISAYKILTFKRDKGTT